MLKHLTVARVQSIITEAKKLNQKHPPSDLGINLASDEVVEGVIAYENDSIPLKKLNRRAWFRCPDGAHGVDVVWSRRWRFRRMLETRLGKY